MSNIPSSEKSPKGFRLTLKARALLSVLAEKHGVKETAVVEMAIREKAEREKIELPHDWDKPAGV